MVNGYQIDKSTAGVFLPVVLLLGSRIKYFANLKDADFECYLKFQ